MKTPIPIQLLVALAVSGCQAMTPQAKDVGKGGEDKITVVERGIGQVRDEDTGEAFYVLCEFCAKPTLKTRYLSPVPAAVVYAPPVAAVQVAPEPVVVGASASETTQVPQPKGQPIAFKHGVPFAFGRSRLGPQGREAMNAILKEAQAADHVHIRGNTDIIGTISSNKRLAKARAVEIRTYLAKSGISLDKLSTSYCIDCFEDSNETRAGRAANRRATVEMRLAQESLNNSVRHP